MHIGKNSVVSIRYIMKNSKNEVLENTMDGSPVSYLHGSADILAVLQSQLEGLKTGDKKIVHLTAAPGSVNEDFIFEVTVDQVREAMEEEIMLGYPVRADVPKCEADCECYEQAG